METSSTSKFIYFIPYSSTDLKKFDLDSNEISDEVSPDDFILAYGPHLVPITEKKLFIQGGIVELELVSNCFIYDTENKTFEQKPCGRICGAGACVKFENFVFIFGGASPDGLKPSEHCQRYNLENENWDSISQLPVASYNNTCGVKENQILIVGQHLNALLYYSPQTNTYTDCILIESQYKLLLIHENSLFIVAGNTIKALENNEWKDYSNGCKQIFSTIYSYSVHKNGYIYFLVPANDIVRLNLDTKILELISS